MVYYRVKLVLMFKRVKINEMVIRFGRIDIINMVENLFVPSLDAVSFITSLLCVYIIIYSR
jgi:hypothetical protein